MGGSKFVAFGSVASDGDGLDSDIGLLVDLDESAELYQLLEMRRSAV